jgi:uncharacterized Zn finger protein
MGKGNDIRRSGTRSQAGAAWWVERWRAWGEKMGLMPETDRETSPRAGLTGGRIKRLEVGHGVVSAVVQTRSQTTCQIEIRIAPWSEAQWLAALEAMSDQAVYAAQLLAGELPPELDAALTEAGAPLLPAHQREVTVTCDGAGCEGGPCVHTATVLTQLGEALTDDPWLLLRMRGRDQTQVLAALRKARTQTNEGAGTSPQAASSPGSSRFHRNPAEAAAQEEVPPLEGQMEQYWGVSKALEGYRPHLNEPKVDAVLLRRLGPLPFSDAEGHVYEELTSIYRQVSREALRRAFAPDDEQDK